MILDELHKISPLPSMAKDGCVFLTRMGSHAYGTSQDDSDIDLYGFSIPPLETLFPHTYGHILGFGPTPPEFQHVQRHHIRHPDGSEYDLVIYNIVKYCNMLIAAAPNIVDSIFTPVNCIAHITTPGRHIRDNRKLFLSKEVFKSMRGYANSNFKKVTEAKKEDSKRAKLVLEFGYDLKGAAHIVRIMDECYQALMTGDIDLQENKEVIKSIRRGEWPLEKIQDHYATWEANITKAYVESNALPETPRYDECKEILLQALEMHFGNLNVVRKSIVDLNRDANLLEDLKNLVSAYEPVK